MKPTSLTVDLDGSWLSDLAEDVNKIAGSHNRIHENRFVFPPSIAEGHAALIHVEKGLSLCILDAILQTEVSFLITNKNYSAVHFRYSIGSLHSEEAVDNEHNNTNGSNLRSLLIYKGNTPTRLSGRKGAYLNYLFVVMSEEWVRRNVGEMILPDNKHLLRGSQHHFYLYQDIDMPIYTATRQISDVRNIAFDCRSVAYKGIILQLISLSWSKLITQYKETGKISITDKEKMVSYMTRVFSDLSKPLPSVEKLAAEIYMSKSKFNLLFKKIYQKNVYAYYSEIRMHKAMALLKSGRFTVAGVAHEISYMNLGHFSRAFSKFYGMLPKDCIPKANIRVRRNLEAHGGR